MKKQVKTDGKIPNEKWLREHGFAELIDVMKAHPEKFKHLQQAK